jgi:DNA-binding LacI/PurR family transcriptional regulator
MDITTVRQPLEMSGRIGARLLFRALAEPDGPVQHVTLELELVPRGSS